MHTTKTLAATLLCLLSVPLMAQQVSCQDEMTITSCLNEFAFNRRIADALPQEAASETRAAAEAEAQENNQAGASAAGGQARSTVTDLLPWFNALGLLSDSDASDGTIALDLNFLLPVQKRENTHRNSQLKWQLDLASKPFEPLIAALPEGVREARKKELQDRIGDTADSELQFSYSVVSKNLGRDFRRQGARLTALLAPVFIAAPEGEIRTAVQEAQALMVMNRDTLESQLRILGVTAPEISNLPLARFTREQRRLIDEFVAKTRDSLGKALATKLTVIQDAAIDSKADALAKLVLLQPQLVFSANKRFRDELVGPEQIGFKVSYERSFVSLNDFIKKSGAFCKKLADFDGNLLTFDESRACLGKLSEYMEQHADDIDSEDRVIASLEYKKVDRWQFALPDDAIDLDRPKFDRIIASVGYGRAVRSQDRVDFEAAYDSNLDDDDSYKSRFVVTLTYTRHFDEMDLPLSIVYANKSEFLEGTDKQIGLHFGVKFRALDK